MASTLSIRKIFPQLLTKDKTWLWVLLGFFGILFYTIVFFNHYFFRTHAFDYGVYNYSLWDYSHFRISQIPVTNALGVKMNFMQDHFSLMLLYFIPVFWLLGWLGGTYTLLFICVSLILWSGWAVYKLITLKTNDGWLGVAAVLYYFLLQNRYSAFAADANISIMASSLIPLFVYFFEAKRFLIASVFFLLALFSREDMPLWLAFIIPVLIYWNRKDKKTVKLCAGYFVFAVAYFILLFKVLIPLTETPDKSYHLFNYSILGANPGEALLHIISHPLSSFKNLFVNHSGNAELNGIKEEFYLVYLVSGGFMLFLRPRYFIWFIPLIAQKMWNDDPIRWSIQAYFCIPVITMLPVSVFLIVSHEKQKQRRYMLAAIVCTLTLLMTVYKMEPSARTYFLSDTVKENILHPQFFNPGYDAAKIHEALKVIPDDASVCASQSILPHLSQRKKIYEFPGLEDAGYAAVFSFHDFYKIEGIGYNKALNDLLANPEWTLKTDEPPFLLFKKEKKNLLFPNSILCDAESLDESGEHFIGAENKRIRSSGAQSTEKFHSGKQAVKLTPQNPYSLGYDYNVEAGDLVRISAFRYSTDGNGSLVADGGKNFYNQTNPDSVAGKWKEVVLVVEVPPGISTIKVFAWNQGDKAVWFDDLRIETVYRKKIKKDAKSL
jgi:uncharacterized membrane protein